MSDKPSLGLILTTFSEETGASAVVRQLLEERLIACGTILPGARSLYHWKGKLEESTEVFVLLKTEAGIAPRCMERLTELHPYEVPEIIELNPVSVSAPYAEWVRESLRKSQ
jgi:periplasmic divalent cation tolerance protein